MWMFLDHLYLNRNIIFYIASVQALYSNDELYCVLEFLYAFDFFGKYPVAKHNVHIQKKTADKLVISLLRRFTT